MGARRALARGADLCCLGTASPGRSLALPSGGGPFTPIPAQVPQFLTPGGQPGQEPAFPAFLPSELSARRPHLHPSSSGGEPTESLLTSGNRQEPWGGVM